MAKFNLYEQSVLVQLRRVCKLLLSVYLQPRRPQWEPSPSLTLRTQWVVWAAPPPRPTLKASLISGQWTPHRCTEAPTQQEESPPDPWCRNITATRQRIGNDQFRISPTSSKFQPMKETNPRDHIHSKLTNVLS